jgi:hypothetical protein
MGVVAAAGFGASAVCGDVPAGFDAAAGACRGLAPLSTAGADVQAAMTSTASKAIARP